MSQIVREKATEYLVELTRQHGSKYAVAVDLGSRIVAYTILATDAAEGSELYETLLDASVNLIEIGMMMVVDIADIQGEYDQIQDHIIEMLDILGITEGAPGQPLH